MMINIIHNTMKIEDTHLMNSQTQILNKKEKLRKKKKMLRLYMYTEYLE